MKIELFLLLLLLAIFDCLLAKQQLKDGFKLSSNSVIEKPKTIDPPGGPYCQNLVAFYTGQFSGGGQTSFNAEFQLRLDADLTKRKIHMQVDHWNEQTSKSSDFQLDFYYGTTQNYCEVDDDDCSESFTKEPTDFKLDIDHEDGSFYHLMYFPYFNNSFALTDSVSGCTRHQLKGLNDSYVPNLDEMSFCVCCDAYNPDPSLGCPINPWTQPATSKPPATKTITCKNVIAKFNGIFQNKEDSNKMLDVDFQVSLNASDAEQRTYFTMDYWNNDNVKTSDIRFWAVDSEYGWVRCNPVNNTNCYIPYVTQNTDFFIELDYYSNNEFQNVFWFLYVTNYDNSFTFDSIDGKCTNNVPSHPYTNGPDTTLFNACMCCDDYSPDSSLNCPVA